MENRIKVVIPTDFSVQGEYAYIMVKNLSEKLDMDITFLHVLSVPDTVTMDKNGKVETCGEIDVKFIEQQKEMALRKLEQIKAAHGDHINTKLVFGKTTTGIVEYSENYKMDLIVMGTKGSSGLTERIVGSEAQVVARKSNIPVLSLMCDRSEFDLNNIVLVHNFEETGNQRLELLVKFMNVFGTNIHLLHILKGGKDFPDKAEAAMKEFAKSNGIEHYKTYLLNDTDIEAGVIHFDQMNNMDMVCVGTHGKGGVFHSSAAERLINHMYKPVISFRIK